MICWAEYPSVKTLPLLPNPQPSPPVYHHHRLSLCYLEGDFSCHGEAMGDNRLFFCGATLPTVQFNAAAPRKEDLFVHLDRRVACELAGCTEHTNTKNSSYRYRLSWSKKKQDAHKSTSSHFSRAHSLYCSSHAVKTIQLSLSEAGKSHHPVTISEAIISSH